MSAPKTVVELDNVSVVFGDSPEKALPLMDGGETREKIQNDTGQILGVHDCTLSIPAGEIVVLMGLSGSGKSTLLRVVNRLNTPTRGHIRVDNGISLQDITAANHATLRTFRTQHIAMVFQQFALLPWRTVAENVGFGLEVAGISAKDKQSRVNRQLEMVGLSNWGHCHVHELSGGMQQRVGLARALVTEAPILLMDEPFSALDPLIRVRLQDELLNLQQQLQRTILFVSHDLDEALKIGSRIVIMEGGRVVQIGTPEDIVLNPSTDYVTEFVAHMNPMTALRAATVMRPLTADDKPSAEAPRLTVDSPLRDVILLKKNSDAAVYVEDNGVVVGCVDNREIYRALLR